MAHEVLEVQNPQGLGDVGGTVLVRQSREAVQEGGQIKTVQNLVDVVKTKLHSAKRLTA